MNASELNILAFDTVTEACSVALNLRGAVTQRLEVAANGHSRRVLTMAQNLLSACGLSLRELDALAVDIGPGSFTGVRIGIGVAQGLAYGAGLQVIAVNSLEALAEGVLRPGDGENDRADAAATVLPAIDARMGQVYCALYGSAAPGAIIEPALRAPGEVAHGGHANITGLGSGWDRHAPALLEALDGSVSSWLAGRHPQAAGVARIAAARGLQSAVSPLHLRATYIRNEVAQTTAQRRAPGPA